MCLACLRRKETVATRRSPFEPETNLSLDPGGDIRSVSICTSCHLSLLYFRISRVKEVVLSERMDRKKWMIYDDEPQLDQASPVHSVTWNEQYLRLSSLK